MAGRGRVDFWIPATVGRVGQGAAGQSEGSIHFVMVAFGKIAVGGAGVFGDRRGDRRGQLEDAHVRRYTPCSNFTPSVFNSDDCDLTRPHPVCQLKQVVGGRASASASVWRASAPLATGRRTVVELGLCRDVASLNLLVVLVTQDLRVSAHNTPGILPRAPRIPGSSRPRRRTAGRLRRWTFSFRSARGVLETW